MTAARSPVTQGALAVLRTTSVPVDVGHAPGDAIQDPNAITFPYFVLYPTFTSTVGGPPFADPQADATFNFDVWAIGENAEHAEAVMDAGLAALVGRALDRTYLVAWPAGAEYQPEPAERVLLGWGPSGATDDRRLAWCSAEVAIAILT